MTAIGGPGSPNITPKLEDLLKELGLEPSKEVIDKLNPTDLRKFSAVFEKLKSGLDYKVKTLHDNEQFYKILEVSQLEGDVFGAIDILAESGYNLHTNINREYHYLRGKDVSIIEMLAKADPQKYLKTFKMLKKKMEYTSVNDHKYNQYSSDNNSDYSDQARRVLKIANLKGDVEGAVAALVESGYNLHVYNKGEYSYLRDEDVSIIKTLAKADQQKYLKTFKTLKEKIGYTSVNDHLYNQNLFNKNSDYSDQARKVLKISNLEGNVEGAIDALADGYCLHVRKKGKYKILVDEDIRLIKKLTRYNLRDMKAINRITSGLWNKELESLGLDDFCLYKGHAKSFIDYFSNLIGVEEKKNILRAIFNCDYENQEIIDWLDKHETALVKEVGLEPDDILFRQNSRGIK